MLRLGLLRKEIDMAAKKTHSFEVGDVLASSWGYEQTNITLYQVVALNGASMVTVKRCRLPVKSVEAYGGMSEDVCFVLPEKGKIVAEDGADPIRRKVRNYYRDQRPEGDLIEISSYENAYRYDGGKMYRSWYA